METRHSRLKKARELTGHETAQAFADRHGIPGSSQRARESGGRGITATLAMEYETCFRQYSATRKITADWLLYGDKRAKEAAPSQPGDPLQADINDLTAGLTNDQRRQLWPWLVEWAKLIQKAG